MPTGFRELSAVAECFEDQVGTSTTDCGGGRKKQNKTKDSASRYMFIPTLSFWRTGGGVEEDWRRIEGGSEEDRRRVGGRLEEDWRRLGGGLED